jgi:3-methyladenine DNA glycosylase/8-oxoguanine DNA glycosylase
MADRQRPLDLATILDVASHNIEIPQWVDLASTVRGSKDPVMIGPGETRWNTRTPDGLGSLRLERVSGSSVSAEAWGPGADWMMQQAPRLLGAEDDVSDFHPPPGKLSDQWRARPFLLGRTDRLWDSLVGAILGQKVQAKNAYKSRRMIARRYGDEAPGPDGGSILPSPERTAELGYADFHPLGVERKRAEILLRVAREMGRLADLEKRPPDYVRGRLERIRGIGPWTTGMVTATALGDADAVPVGDYHIPNTVAWHLAGEERADDDRMLELLEPWLGHRWRVIRLAKASGGAPKRGPKLSLTGDGLHMERRSR